jgi:hypothetical protein
MPETTVSKSSATATKQPVLIDLGKKKKKAVKRLRRGSGPLMRAVNDAVDELRSTGKLDTSGQDVIVVVREKKKRRGGSWGW